METISSLHSVELNATAHPDSQIRVCLRAIVKMAQMSTVCSWRSAVV